MEEIYPGIRAEIQALAESSVGGNLGFISRGFGTEQEHLNVESGNEMEE